MTTGDIIIHIFYLVAISLPDIQRHSQAKLYPSELVTIGILYSLKGGYFRAFYRWLERDYGDWFGDGSLPERTRLQRLLKTHKDWCELLLIQLSSLLWIVTRLNCSFPSERGVASSRLAKRGQTKDAGVSGSSFAGCSTTLVVWLTGPGQP